MASTLLEVDGLTKRFGGFTALNRVSLHVKAGERFGLIGPNGSGKTTLINCVSGSLPADGG
ncbi:MAG TPA: ATP-binding cassette domain-containing protein, partial [Methylomirabilota bacterium]|nr:ATP-binding cassette domain-containing protein [Methylomirabilota bacterium]